MLYSRPEPDPPELWRTQEAVKLLAYDPAWSAGAAEEAALIRDKCKPMVLRVEHIGSTAVPGLTAKPVLDLMPLLQDFESGFGCVVPMRTLGYWYAGEYGISGRHFFVKGNPRTHHVHMLVEGSPDAVRHLAVRDILQADPHTAAAYATLKSELAGRFGHDRERYAEAKSGFMQVLLKRAGVQ